MYDREDYLQEKAPPSAKHERMVKHIKARYKEGGLTDKEKAIAYATAWKHYNKEEVEQIDEGIPLVVAAPLVAGGIGLAANALGKGMKKSVDTHAKTKSSDYKNQKGLGANLARKREMMNQMNSYEPSGEMVDERTRYAKETGKSFTTGRSSEEGGDPKVAARNKPPFKYGGSRQEPKERGKKPPRAGEPGSGVQDPAHKVALRRSRRELAKKNPIGSRFDHYEMEGSDLQEKYLYTYLYERNYDALDKDMDGDKDFADVMVARMIASGKSKEEAIKSTMNKEYNKKGKKVKISDGFSNWRDELGEELSKKSPFVDVMPKNGTDSDESGSLKAARKRQQPNQKVTEETLEEFADSLGGFLVEAEQLDELAPLAIGAGALALRAAPYAVRALPALSRIVSTAVKSPAARNLIVKGPKAFKPPTIKPPTIKPPTPGPKPSPAKPPTPTPTPGPAKPPTPTPTPGPAKPPTPTPTPGPAKPPGTKPSPAKPGAKPKIDVGSLVTGAAAATGVGAAVNSLLKPTAAPTPQSDVPVPAGPSGPSGGVPAPEGSRKNFNLPLPKIRPYSYVIGRTSNPQ